MTHILRLSIAAVLILTFSFNAPGDTLGFSSSVRSVTIYLPLTLKDFPHIPDQIAYNLTYPDYSEHDIFLINDDGSQMTNLTSIAAEINYHEWSPDGTKIIFESDYEIAYDYNIYLLDVDSGQISQVTANPEYDGSPSWGPNSQQLVYESWDGINVSIYKYDLGTGVESRLTDPAIAAHHPDWSPDGSKIAFSAGQCASPQDCNGVEIYTMNPDGSGIQNLTDNTFYDFLEAWSPDSTKMLFLSNRNMEGSTKADLFMMNADGSGVYAFTEGGRVQNGNWSATGTQVVYSDSLTGTSIVNLDGTNNIPLTCQGETFVATYPAWSPDNTRIAYAPSSCWSGGGDTSCGIYIITFADMGCTHLVSDLANRPLWRPKQ